MKLIMENWRQFVEQQEVITIDESLLLPEFLKGDLNEEYHYLKLKKFLLRK